MESGGECICKTILVSIRIRHSRLFHVASWMDGSLDDLFKYIFPIYICVGLLAKNGRRNIGHNSWHAEECVGAAAPDDCNDRGSGLATVRLYT